MKVGIIGAGAVGSACLTALVMRSCAREIVVLDRDRKRSRGLVTDVQYGAVLSPGVEVWDGDYADLKGASLVMITAGVNEKTGGATDRNDPAGRLRLLDANVDVYKDIVPRLEAAEPRALVLVVSDPPDWLAGLASARLASMPRCWASMARPRSSSGLRPESRERRYSSCWRSPPKTPTTFAAMSSKKSATPI